MWEYTEKVMEHFLHPKNVGEIEDADAVGEVGSMQCGDLLKLYLKIKNGKIVDAKFKTFGCASAIASASALTELIKGKTLEEAAKITNKDIAEFLGGLPDMKLHCSVMGEEALEAALKDYYKKLGKEFKKTRYMVCHCFGLTNEDIINCIKKYNLKTVDEVGEKCKAGTSCGKCKGEIQKILADVNKTIKEISREEKNGKVDILRQ